MRSKKERGYYVVVRDGDKFPIKFKKKMTDDALSNLKKAFDGLDAALQDVYEASPELYYIVSDEVLNGVGLDDSSGEGKCWRIRSASWGLENMMEQLANGNDEILPEEEIATLADIGYRDAYCDGRLWEKIMEDTGEKEVVEEIQKYKGEILRRIRTTHWEKTSYGRSSTSILYRKLPVGKKLRKACENTFREKVR